MPRGAGRRWNSELGTDREGDPAEDLLRLAGSADLPGEHGEHVGGTVYPTARVDEICDRAHERGLKVHMDGARIFNAATALGEKVSFMTRKVTQ